MNATYREFSAKVKIELLIGEQRLSVRQSSAEFLIMSYPWPLPPSVATLILAVDDAVSRTQIFLTEGLRPGRDEHPIVILHGMDV